MKGMYWNQSEPIKEDKDKRINFIRAGLEEIGFPDEELADNIEQESIKFRKNFRLRTIKWKKDGPRYP